MESNFYIGFYNGDIIAVPDDYVNDVTLTGITGELTFSSFGTFTKEYANTCVITIKEEWATRESFDEGTVLDRLKTGGVKYVSINNRLIYCKDNSNAVSCETIEETASNCIVISID